MVRPSGTPLQQNPSQRLAGQASSSRSRVPAAVVPPPRVLPSTEDRDREKIETTPGQISSGPSPHTTRQRAALAGGNPENIRLREPLSPGSDSDTPDIAVKKKPLSPRRDPSPRRGSPPCRDAPPRREFSPLPGFLSPCGDVDGDEDTCSSATECGMSPSAVDSSCPTTPEPYWEYESILERKKRQLVNTGMAAFNQAFDMFLTNAFAITNRSGASDGDQDGSGDGSGGGQPDGSEANHRSLPTQPVGGQKRQLGDRDDDEAEDLGDGNAGDRAGNKRAKKNPRRFACPYFKHNPAKYRTERTCCGPGWLDLHRLKEHLLRKHKLPRHCCNRCFESFKSDGKLVEHQRAKTPCPVKETAENPWDGFDEIKEKELRARQTGSDDTEKWKKFYRILFPDEAIPSPFYEDKDASRASGSRPNGIAPEIVEYEEYLRREIPPKVRRKLEAEVEEQLNCVEESMKDKAVEIFRELQVQLFELWTRGSRGGAGGSSGSSGNNNGNGTTSNGNVNSNGKGGGHDPEAKRHRPDSPSTATPAPMLDLCHTRPELLTPADTLAPPPGPDKDGLNPSPDPNLLSPSSFFDFEPLGMWPGDDASLLESILDPEGTSAFCEN